MSSITDQHFEYVAAFLDENGDEDILALWQDESNKKKFESSTKKKSATKKKDPNAPKKAKSSYNCFCEAKREEVKAKYPEENILSKLGAEWTAFKALCDAGDEDANEEMEVYKAAAVQSKEDYTAAMAVYKPPSDDDEPNAKPAKNETKDAKDKSVKKTNGYNLFLKDKRIEMSDFDGKYPDFVKLVAPMWQEHKREEDEVFQRYTQLAEEMNQSI